MAIYTFGALLFIAGLMTYALRARAFARVAAATKDNQHAFTWADRWLNTRQAVIREKLATIIEAPDTNETVRSDAERVLRLEVLCYLLTVPGMLLMLLGAFARS